MSLHPLGGAEHKATSNTLLSMPVVFILSALFFLCFITPHLFSNVVYFNPFRSKKDGCNS